ncbi:MAG TPA: AAA family ATPase [Thermoanaerobaculia bacterium]|nr:AAA family ATPase [Thermoanaerobaculia bacterium]HUM28677.1 AAA family ATPase [Thermoanaerobaculia bacterium]HXK66715.1 AAA family ATPase [Thermoanaerobaculia bacterium]
MTLERIDIIRFRNLKNQTVSTAGPWVSVSGPNAQGKSNFLEAVSILANGKDLRDNHIHAVPRGEAFWSLRGRVSGVDRIAAYKDSSLSLSLNGKSARTADFMARGGAIYADDGIFWKWFMLPEERRKFLDRVLLLKDATYLDHYQSFSRILQQRNTALRKGCDPDLYRALTDQFVEHSAMLNRLRQTLTVELQEGLNRKLSAQGIDVLLYYPTYKLSDYQKLAQRFRPQEVRRGFSLFGPQREDLTLLIDRKPAVRILSLGQKKMLFLFLILVAAELLPSALLIIDDFDTDLDPSRMEQIYRIFSESPVQKITASLSPANHGGVHFTVQKGRLTPAKESL